MNKTIFNFQFSKQKGFTLIELLVVIGIIGVLVALSSYNFLQARERARDVQRKVELKQLQNALEMYKNDKTPQSFPALLSDLAPTYIKVVPVDPLIKALVSWSDYSYSVSGLTYSLTACLENEADTDAVASGGSPPCGSLTSGIEYIVTQP